MKLFLFISFFLLSHAFAVSRVRVQLNESEFKQGAMVRGLLTGGPELANLQLTSLKGVNFAETIYFLDVSPLLKKESSERYESDIQVIFTRVPESSSVTGRIGKEEVILEWSPIRVIPVDAPGQMLWADFTAPDFVIKNWFWLWTIPLFIILLVSGYKLWKHLDKKARIKARRRKLRDELCSCSSYEEVVTFWKNKKIYLDEFPHLNDAFLKLEAVLFKYQFKPTQTEEEKKMVIKAYREFLQETEGGLRGV